MNIWKLSVLASIFVLLCSTYACTQKKNTPNAQTKLTEKPKEEREVFTVVEEQPRYEGGIDAFYKYIINEITYPQKAKNTEIEGTVEIKFNIERNGSISDVIASNNIGSGCDQEAIRVIKSAPDFIAGSQRGRTIKTAMLMPITFKLNRRKKNADNSIQGTIIAGKLKVDKAELKLTSSYNNGEWSGTVLSSEGESLPGVNIVVAGTNFGTVSALNGTFRVKAEKDQELHISCVGYKNVIVKQS